MNLRCTDMSELEEAWVEVHEALPARWDVVQPSYHVEDGRWHVFAADHRRRRRRPDYVEAIGLTEAQALRELGRAAPGMEGRADRGIGLASPTDPLPARCGSDVAKKSSSKPVHLRHAPKRA